MQVVGGYAQQPAPQVPALADSTATPAQTPAPTPAPAKKKQKKPKEPPPPAQPEDPNAPKCEVTIRAESFGQGGVSSVNIRIESTRNPGPPITGSTNYSGEFRVSLRPGDYVVMLDQGATSVRQDITVDASSTKTVFVNFPVAGGRGPSL